MSVIGIYDWDFFNYPSVIPNLECGKLNAFHKKKYDITVLTPQLIPNKFSRYYIRKDYYDALYPRELFLNNVQYGGKAFSDTYISMDLKQENIVPDFSSYEQYDKYFGSTKTSQALFKRILRAAHCRFSLDEHNLNKTFDYGRLIQQKTSGIIFHDYHPEQIEGLVPFLKDLSKERRILTGERIKIIPIGNKFPIKLRDSTTLFQWLDIPAMNNILFIQYQGLMKEEDVINLVEQNKKVVRQIYYDPCYGIDEENFLKYHAIEFYKQLLYLRTERISININFDEEKVQNSYIQNMFRLFNLYLNSAPKQNTYSMPKTQTFYRFCAAKRVHNLTKVNLNIPSVQEMREVLGYVRVKNYELFKLFYEVEKGKIEGGKIVIE